MKGSLRSRLVFILAAFLMLAVAIIVPLAGSITRSHAAAPKVVSPSSAPPTITTITKDSCATETMVGGEFNAHDQVHVSVVLTTTDRQKDEQNEPLVLMDIGTNFNPSIAIPNGQSSITQSFDFQAASISGDVLLGCINGEGGAPGTDEGGNASMDEKAVITVTVTPAATPTPTPTPPPTHRLDIESLRLIASKNGHVVKNILVVSLENTLQIFESGVCAVKGFIERNPLECFGLAFQVAEKSLGLINELKIVAEGIRLIAAGYSLLVCDAGVAGALETGGISLVACVPIGIIFLLAVIQPCGDIFPCDNTPAKPEP